MDFPVNVSTVIIGGVFKVTPIAPHPAISFTYAASAGDLMNISFDLGMGNSTAADSLSATAYLYDGHTVGPVFAKTYMPNDGTYNVPFTGPAAGGTYNSMYFEFTSKTGTVSPHYFTLDNLAIGIATGGIPSGGSCSGYANLFMGYFPDLLMHTDYYAFGQQMPGRTWTASNYRYGMNGAEKNDEIDGSSGAYYDTYYRLYDARLGKWLSRDPLTFPDESPYTAMANNPIAYSDPSGDKIKYGSAKDWARTQWKRATDSKFRKEFKALKKEYSGKVLDKDGKETGKEKILHIDRDSKSSETLADAVSEHKITTGGSKTDGQDYLKYNGNIDKIVVSEQSKGSEDVGGNGDLAAPPDGQEYSFKFYLHASASLGDQIQWKITPTFNDMGILISSSLSNHKSLSTYWDFSLRNINKNSQGGDGNSQAGRMPTWSLDHTMGWGSGFVIFKVEALGLPKIYSAERRIFGGYRNISILKDYNGNIDRKIYRKMSISVNKVN